MEGSELHHEADVHVWMLQEKVNPVPSALLFLEDIKEIPQPCQGPLTFAAVTMPPPPVVPTWAVGPSGRAGANGSPLPQGSELSKPHAAAGALHHPETHHPASLISGKASEQTQLLPPSSKSSHP